MVALRSDTSMTGRICHKCRDGATSPELRLVTLPIWGKRFGIEELDDEARELVARFSSKVDEGDRGWQEELRSFLVFLS